MTRTRAESGQVLAIVALVLVVLLLAAGLAIDMGYLRYEKRLVQTAADSAAIAGAAKIPSCLGSAGCGSIVDEGQNNSSYNGFTNNPPATQVQINNPPMAGPYQGNENYVEAVIIQRVPTFFMKILGSSFQYFSITARTVATPGPGPTCVYALSGLGL